MINRPTKRVQVTPSNISKSFSHKMAAETAGIDMERNYATVTLCINVTYLHRQPGSFTSKLALSICIRRWIRYLSYVIFGQ